VREAATAYAAALTALIAQPRETDLSTVNPDCTGTMMSTTPNSPDPLKFAFVVVRHGTEIHAVLDANALSTVFIKVD
jgi:hypothetical protein